MPDTPVPAAPKGWDIDKRQAIGIALGLLCLGIIVGFKLAGGVPPIETPVDRVVFRSAPCADCAEKTIQAERAAPTFAEPQEAVPGDSSIPED